MSFKVDLKRSSRQILLDLIGKSNDVQLTPGALLFGTPVTIAEAQSAGSNTKVPVIADPRKVILKGGDEFFYNRLPLEDLVGDASLEMPSSGVIHSLDNALAQIFKDLELGVTSEDFESQTIAGHGHTVPYNMPLTVSSSSLAYTGGTFDIGWALFDQLVASAGTKSCRYDLRRTDAVFQDAVGTTPVTGSAQPLGRLVDLFGKGNHANQPTITARPEYWIDPTTNEPVTWYDFADDRLLWPGVAGADGTVGIAFSTGAQVFDLVAPAHIPPGPMIELMFFDRTLSDLECAVLQCYLEMQVKDTSWLGYVRGTAFDFYLEPYLQWKASYPTAAEVLETYRNSEIYVEFSKDGRVSFPEPVVYEDSEYVEVVGDYTTTVARQRFRLGTKDLSQIESINYDDFGRTWTPDCTAKLNAQFPKAFIQSYHIAYGCIHAIRRGDNPVVPVSFIDINQSNAVFRYYGKPFSNSYVLPNTLKLIRNGSVLTIFSTALPDFSNVKDSLHTLVMSFASLTAFNPSIAAFDFTGFTALEHLSLKRFDFGGSPLPTLPPNLSSMITFDSCNIGGTIPPDYFTNPNNLYMIVLSNNVLTGNVPRITKTTDEETNLYVFHLNNNQLTGYVGGGLKVFNNTYGQYYLQNNLLTQAAVDLLISDFLAAAQFTPGSAGSKLHLNGTGNSAPSVQGKANAAILRTLGWTVLHNN